MSLRVVDRVRWRRVKVVGVGIAWLVAVMCAGGLEAEGTEPIPSVRGFFVASAACVALLYNLVREERRR